MATRAPSFARRRAMPRPMRFAAPVTRMILPVRLWSGGGLAMISFDSAKPQNIAVSVFAVRAAFQKHFHQFRDLCHLLVELGIALALSAAIENAQPDGTAERIFGLLLARLELAEVCLERFLPSLR